MDRTAADLYLHLGNSDIVESVEIAPGVVLDYNDEREVVGIETLRLSTRSADLDLSDFHFEAVQGPASRRGLAASRSGVGHPLVRLRPRSRALGWGG